ncbi:MAG: ABC transporter permease [Alphaproteobacteria bacterium]|nr:ABC transporter permease [Alphaproteobacteria bacterium]
MTLLRIAWRNVWRNSRRSLVTIAAMAFALWTTILYSGLVQGYLDSMEGDVLDLEVGDLQIHPEAWDDEPGLSTVIEDPAALVAALEEAGLTATVRLLSGGLAASDEASAGVVLRGLDPVADARALKLPERLGEGRWLAADAPKGVVIGRRLARALGVGLGDELVVLSQAADGSVANDLFAVRGILGPVSEGTDRAAIFLLDTTFRELFVLPRGAHEIIVRRPADLPLDEAAARARTAAGPAVVQTWRELLPTIATMLDSSRSVMVFVFLIIYLAIGILVLNAVLMAVFERVRELGVMKALGMGPWAVLALIVTETAIQTVLAIAVGTLLAAPFAWYLTVHGINVGALGGTAVMGLAMAEVWTGSYDLQNLTTAVVLLLVIVAFATLIPAIRAARLRPIDAMRYQ